MNIYNSKKAKPKVAVIIDSISALGGTQTYARLVKRQLEKLNYSIDIISVKHQSDTSYKSLDLKYNVQLIYKKKALQQLLKNYDFAIIISGQVSIYTFWYLNGRCVIHRESNNPLYRMGDQTLLKSYFQKTLFWLMKKYSRKLKIMSPSQFVSGAFEDFQHVQTIENFLDGDALSFQNMSKITDENYFFIGRPTHAKGFDRFLKIAAACQSKRFLFVGPKLSLTLTNVTQLGIRSTGQIFEDVNTIIITSRTEGFPNLLNEAVIAGVNVILSNEMRWLASFEYVKPYIIFIGEETEIANFINQQRTDVTKKDGLDTDVLNEINKVLTLKLHNYLQMEV